MEIEPLHCILEWSEDKKDTLLYYLPNKVSKKVSKYELEEDKLYIQDRIYCIKRNTLELEHEGSIIYIDDGMIGLKINNIKTIRLDPKKYYIFVKCKKSINKQREFMKQLLEQL